MKQILSPQEWAEELKEFTSANEKQPPTQITEKIFSKVHTDLNPPPGYVFSKLSLIHGIVGTVTLLFCPQFGFAPFSDIGLMDVFMNYGELACMLGCGAVYIGSSTLAASFLLKIEEIKVLRKTEILQLPILGLLSMGVLICFGATAVLELTTLAWLFGSVLGGAATLELGWLVRRKLFSINQ